MLITRIFNIDYSLKFYFGYIGLSKEITFKLILLDSFDSLKTWPLEHLKLCMWFLFYFCWIAQSGIENHLPNYHSNEYKISNLNELSKGKSFY